MKKPTPARGSRASVKPACLEAASPKIPTGHELHPHGTSRRRPAKTKWPRQAPCGDHWCVCVVLAFVRCRRSRPSLALGAVRCCSAVLCPVCFSRIPASEEEEPSEVPRSPGCHVERGVRPRSLWPASELNCKLLLGDVQLDWHAAVADSHALLHDLQRKDFSARQWLLGKGVGHH